MNPLRDNEGGSVDGPGKLSLSAPLHRLLGDPRRPGAIRLWQALSPEERLAAGQAYLADEDGARKKLNTVVAKARNFRPGTVAKWTDRKILEAMRYAPLRDYPMALRLLHCHHVPGQLQMVTSFLDALGVVHERGSVESFDDVDAAEDTVRSVVADQMHRFGAQAIAVYLLCLHMFGSPAGDKGRQSLLALVAESAGDRARSEAPVGTEEAEEERADKLQAEQDDPTRQRTFTTLDRLLIHAAVDSVQGIQGALTEDELDDVVDELVELNGRRHQSYFHTGFRDVLLGKPLGKELPAENTSRLRWYWTGAVQGWARRERWDRIVREHATNPVVKELGSGSNAASVAAVRHIVEALLREGRTTEIAGFVNARALVGQPLYRLLLDAASELLSKGDAAGALPIFELLMAGRGRLTELGVPSTDRLLLDAHRRMAHCLRHLHQHARAEETLRTLLQQEPDPNIHAMVHADLGLIAGGFDSLEEVVLPERESELEGVLDQLADGVTHFRESVRLDTGYSAHGHYCLGVLALGRAVADHKYEDAERHLQSARVYFSRAGSSYARDMVERGNLYYGVVSAQQLSSTKLAHAADVIVDSLAAGATIPPYLIGPTVEALDEFGQAADLARVVEAILESGDDLSLDELANCDGALRRCPEVTDRLVQRASTGAGRLAARASDWRRAIQGLRDSARFDEMAEALDGLEELVHESILGGVDGGVEDFVELLETPEAYRPAWDVEDAVVALAQCRDAQQRYGQAAQVLLRLFRHYAREETPRALDEAEAVLDYLRSKPEIDPAHYNGATSTLDGLRARVGMRTRDKDPSDGPPTIMRILVVGGDETQARQESAVIERVKACHPHMQLRCIQTGWGSNWSRKLDEIESAMEWADGLVILRFLRTELGRQVRKRWRGSWRSCWSGSPDAIAKAASGVAAEIGKG